MTNTPPGSDNRPADAEQSITDRAISDLNARVHWPQPPNPAPSSVNKPETKPYLPSSPHPYSPSAPRPRRPWRSIGIGALGVLGGVLLALIVQDILATGFVREGVVPTGLAIVLGFLIPIFAIFGAIVAVLIDARTAKRRPERDKER